MGLRQLLAFQPILNRLIHALKVTQRSITDHLHDQPAEQAGEIFAMDEIGLTVSPTSDDKIMSPFEHTQQHPLAKPFKPRFSITFVTTGLKPYIRQVKKERLKPNTTRQNPEHYFQTLIETVDDLVQVVSAQGRVLYSNRRLEAFTGYTQEEAKTLEPFHWIHPEDKERVVRQFEALLMTEGGRIQIQYKVVTKSGAVKHLETKVSNALHDPGIGGVIAIIRDVTARVEAERRADNQGQLYQLLTEISKRFLNSPLQPSIEEMLTSIGQFSQVDRSYAYVLNEQQGHWNCLFEWRSPEGEKVVSQYYQTGVGVEETRWMLEQFLGNKVVNCEHMDELPPEAWQCRTLFEADGTRSILLIPMLAGGKVLGFIGYDTVLQPKKWQEDDIIALRICTEILTSALIRAEAEQAIKQSLSVNEAIIASTAEGILVTDLSDNIVACNETFRKMWLIPEGVLPGVKASTAFKYALKNVENAAEVQEQVSKMNPAQDQHIMLTAYIRNKRVIECISKPQLIDGRIVGRVWSNRDITDRLAAEREEMEKGVAQAQFESLKNQVNPHFLFNSLNVLSSLVYIDAGLSEKFIGQLARSYRYLLEQKDNELVTLKTEIDFVHSFTFLLNIRFEEKLRVNIRLQEEVMDHYVAPLTLQLLIENAVKHNIISAESPLVIDISNEQDTYLMVSNNLQLRQNSLPSTGLGLKNISSRYKLFSPIPPVFGPEGSKYIARIPLIKTPNA